MSDEYGEGGVFIADIPDEAQVPPGAWGQTPKQLWSTDCLKYRGRELTGKFRHWCYDWDFLPVDETTEEINSCQCRFPIAFGPTPRGVEYPQPSGLGDKIAEITKRLGIKECGGCAKRRRALNNVDLDGTALEVMKGLYEALMNPEK